MSYCAPNSHARHTLLKGCCTTSNVCCDNRSSYSAQKYCECNDTMGSNNIPVSDKVALCGILSSTFNGQSFADSDAVYTLLAAINFHGVCNGPFLLTGVPSAGSLINIGTVEKGVFTPTNNTIPALDYTLIINALPISECGTFVVLA